MTRDDGKRALSELCEVWEVRGSHSVPVVLEQLRKYFAACSCPTSELLLLLLPLPPPCDRQVDIMFGNKQVRIGKSLVSLITTDNTMNRGGRSANDASEK